MGAWISTCCNERPSTLVGPRGRAPLTEHGLSWALCDCFGSERKKVTARDVYADVKHFTEDELDSLKEYLIRHDPYLFQGQGCLSGCC